jgi:hypothetical protein
MSWMSALKRAGKAIATGGFSEVPNLIDKISSGKNDDVEKTETKESTDVGQLQAEGRAAAGQASSDAAGLAKKSAKAASMQQSGNKMASAANAAAAAGNAAQQGYADTTNAMTNIAAGNEQGDLNRQLQSDIANANREENRYQQKKQRQMNMFNSMASLGGTLGGAVLSDETKKKVKHTYIPVENRVHKGE